MDESPRGGHRHGVLGLIALNLEGLADLGGRGPGVLPISAATLSYLVLGEPMRPSHLVGAACVVAGIVLVARETEA